MASYIGVRESGEAAAQAGFSELRWSWRGGEAAILGAFLLLLVAIALPTPKNPGKQRPPQDAPWAVHLKRMDRAVGNRDIPNAAREWTEAYASALNTPGWEGMTQVGDAYVRLGNLTGNRKESALVARAMLQIAFSRAFWQASLEGVLRTGEIFAKLGDRAMGGLSLDVAEGLARAHADARVLERLQALKARLGSGVLAGDVR